MKLFDVNSHLEYPKRILKFNGMWPKKSPSLKYNLQGLLSFFLTVSLSLLSAIRGGYDMINGNIENGAFTLCPGIAAGYAAYKIWVLQYNKEEFFKLLEKLQDPELISHEDYLDVYLQNRLNLGTKYFTFVFISCVCASSMIIISELALNYDSIPKSLPDYFDKHNWASNIGVWFFFIVSTLSTGYTIGSYEGLMYNILSFAVIQIEMVQKQITKSIDSYPVKKLTRKEMEESDQRVNELLKSCVKRHNAIERYVQSIEAKFSYSYLVQFMFTLSVTAIVGLAVIFTPTRSINFTRCIIFFIADMSQVIVVCVACDEIIDQSKKVGEACYMSSWRLCGPSVCKTLIIIMERTKRPLHLTAGKFTIISLATYLSCMKMTLSYFTLLKNLYWESN